MLTPSIFGENLFDDFFDDFFDWPAYDKQMKDAQKKLYGRRADNMMKTDVRDHDDHYEIYLNTRQIHKADDWTEANGPAVVKRITNSTLKVGKNVIAVRLQQNTGGAYFDYGLYGIFDPEKAEGITEVEAEKTTFPVNGKAAIFDLSGRKVSVPKRGLYVIDGKKKVVQ